MKEFFETYPLYKEYTLLENYGPNNEFYVFKSHFDGSRFDYHCELENSMRPFKIDLDLPIKPIKHSPENLDSDAIIPDSQFIDEKLNYVFLAPAICQSCQEGKIIFLLQVYSNNPISPIYNNFGNVQLSPRHKYNFPNTNIYVKKVGCVPEKLVRLDKSISKHFDKETNSWLFKAKSCLFANLGIGAFAYCRRIIEKELIKIIEEIRELPESDRLEIGKLLEQYEANPSTSTIYDNIYKFLPNSLKDLGDNPISLLYKTTSSGLHSLTEEDCLEKAESVIKILEYTISKINEEKSKIKDIKDEIKKLRK